jgi:superfamily I DNA/RNA helicase
VGDDWQSIYRFAGSDITIFTQFEANFGPCWQGRLEQTYRCNQLIAETAAKFVQRNPEQIEKTVRSTPAAQSRSLPGHARPAARALAQIECRTSLSACRPDRSKTFADVPSSARAPVGEFERVRAGLFGCFLEPTDAWS